jgi:hypothetical protein
VEYLGKRSLINQLVVEVQGGLGGAVLQEIPSVEISSAQGSLHPAGHSHQKPGANMEGQRLFSSFGGTNHRNSQTPCNWGSMLNKSVGNWSQGSGPLVPNMSFPTFDCSNPKLWKHRCETYFDFYAVDRDMWIRFAIMYFEGPAVFWLQSMEHHIRSMNWEEFCLHLNNRFGRDQHSMLIRQFYHIYQNNTLAEYIEQFDILMHQLLAHEGQLTLAMITARFVDGLKDEIKSVVVIQRPVDLDTACSLAMLQEDVLMHTGKRENRRVEISGYSKPPGKPNSVGVNSVADLVSRGFPPYGEHRNTTSSGHKAEENKLAALKSYRRAKGLCFKCGKKSGYNHSCSSSVPLHLVEEMWVIAVNDEVNEDEKEEIEEQTEASTEEGVLAISVAAVSGSESNKTIRLWASIRC